MIDINANNTIVFKSRICPICGLRDWQSLVGTNLYSPVHDKLLNGEMIRCKNCGVTFTIYDNVETDSNE